MGRRGAGQSGASGLEVVEGGNLRVADPHGGVGAVAEWSLVRAESVLNRRQETRVISCANTIYPSNISRSLGEEMAGRYGQIEIVRTQPMT